MLWWTLRQLKSENGETRRRAVEKLGESKDPKAVEPLIVALTDSDRDVRQGAAAALGRIGDSRAVEPLILALKDSNYDMRRRTAEALGEIGDSRAVEPLIVALNDRNNDVRRGAAEALGKIGWEPKDDTQRALRAVALSKWEEAASLGVTAIELLIPALKDSDWDVRRGAAEALVKIGKAAVEPLIVTLKDRKYSVRRGAAEALGRISDSRAVEPLILALNDRNDDVRQGAAEALVKIGKAAVEPLIVALTDSDWDVRPGAAEALVKIGKAAVEPLIVTLKDRKYSVRRGAAEALGKIGWEPKDDTQRALRAVALSKWEEAASLGVTAIEPLIVALKDSYRVVRQGAAEALGEIGWEPKDDTQRALRAVALSKWEEAASLGVTAIEPLIVALNDRNDDVRQGAAEALVKIGKAAVEPLILALKDSDWDVRRGAAEALGRIGDSRAVEPLILALEDRNDDVRQGAVVALGRLGDSRGVSWLIKRCANATRAYDTIVALTRLLEEAPELIAAEDLRTIANLRNVVQLFQVGDSCGLSGWKEGQPVDCSHVKQLARQELIRRGLAAM